MVINKIFIILLILTLIFYINKLILMNYQKRVTKKYKYLPQSVIKINNKNIDNQHQPYNSTDILEYGIYKTHYFEHPNKLDLKLAKINDGMKIVDAGCGLLGTSIYFSKMLPNSTIYPISNGGPKYKKLINNKIKNKHNIKPIFMDYHLISNHFKNESLDRIIFIESIGFSNNIINLIKDCYRLLKKGGKLYIRTIIIPSTNYKFINNELNEIQRNLNGKLYYDDNIIYFLQNAGFKDIKTSYIPLIYSENLDNISFVNTIYKLKLLSLKKIWASFSMSTGIYVATK